MQAAATKINSGGSVRTAVIGALNIVMSEPHSPDRYVDLLKKAYKSRRAVKIRGQFAGVLGTFVAREEHGFYYGEIFKFYDLNLSGKWLNMIQQAPAEEDWTASSRKSGLPTNILAGRPR
jgi:hypothetical protein